MASHERIRQLCAQFLRAENPDVIEQVAAQLQQAIDQYVQAANRRAPLFEVAAADEASL